jgi:PAS domain S-box-containing protein
VVRTKSLIFSLALLLALACWPDALLAQPGPATPQHIVDLWQQADGLPQNYVFTVIQSRDGYLWIGTRGGVARFDGVRFTSVDDRIPGQLRESEVWALAEDRDSALWVGTYGGGLTRIHRGRFTNFDTRNGLPSNRIRSLAADRDGSLWIGTENGLAHRQDDRFTIVAPKGFAPGHVVTALHADRNGVLWIGTQSGLWSLRAGRLVDHTAAHPDTLSGTITAIAGDDEKGLWVGIEPGAGHEGGLRRLANDSITTYSVHEGLASEHVLSLVVDGDTVWVGTRQGLCRSRGGRFEQYTNDVWGFAGVKVLDRVAQQGVPALAIDHEGSLWFGTQLDGLGRLRRAPLLYANGGAPDERGVDVRSLIEDDNGVLWIGTAHDLRRVDVNGQTTTYATIPAAAAADALTLTRDDTLLVGSPQGLYELRSGRLQSSTWFPASAPPNVVVLFTDSRGDIWIGTRNDGVYRHTAAGLVHITSHDGLLGDQVRAIAEGHDGTIWIGTRGGGVSGIRDGRIDTFGVPQGLAGQDVQALAVDSSGTVWAGTRQGLSRIKNGHVASITASRGLPANFFYQIIEDGDRLWMTCARGIARMPLEQLNAVADGRAAAVATDLFGSESGMAHTTVTLAHQPTALKRRDGRLWFATSRGAAVLDLQALPRNTIPPPVHIEEVAINRKDRAVADGMRLDPDQRDIEIRYTALSFVVPQRVQFRYRLEGFDDDWVEAGTSRAAHYTNLPRGQYRFRVIAANNDGVWNKDGASLAFEVLPLWYERPWVRALMAAGVVLLALLVHQRRLAQLQARERELSIRVDERTDALARLMAELEDRIKDRTAELATSNSALLAEKERLAVTLRSIGDGVIATDVSGRVALINRVAEGLTGWSAAAAVGEPLDRVFQTLDRYTRRPLGDAVRAVLSDSDASAGGVPRLLIAKDGRELLVADSAAPIRDPDSRIVGAVFVFRDVTEREKMEEQLRNTQKLEALGVLAGGIAHDFNNLLTGMFGFVEMASEHATDPRAVEEHTGRAMAVFDKARSLTRQLLTFSKAGEPVRHSVHLERVVRDAVSFVLSGSNVVADFSIDPDLWPCEVDEQQIAQVIDNLVLNARQAMTAGGVVSIRLENQRRNSNDRQEPVVRLSVLDNGPGIPLELRPRIFDPFFTTKSGGTGLGLAVVHSIVRRHGGHVEVGDAHGGHGTRIDVFLPAAPSAIARTSGDAAMSRPIPSARPARVLVMDDEDHIRNFARAALKRLGHEALLAKDDREAVSLLQEALREGKPIDAAILDMTIPGGPGGVEALRRLRAVVSDLPAVASSGYSADTVLTDPERHGYDAALPKPFRLAQLDAVLSRVLAKRPR